MKHLEINQILALNNPYLVDIALNKQNQSKIHSWYNQIFRNGTNFGIK